ncbi:MAG: shikimate kinase [Candidatus Binatia bacterium]
MKTDKLYLVGFMGAGKTTVGRALAKRLDWRFEDIDERIERTEGRDVASIFRQSGEPYFRACERQALADLLDTRGVVVATGGGTPVDPANRALMARDGAVAWLDAPFATVAERVPADGRRPLAANRAEMERLYNERRAAYAQAHARFDVSRSGVDEVVDHVVDWLEP